MRMIIIHSLLMLFYQLLTPVAYANFNIKNDCKENSVKVEDEESAYRNVNLFFGDSFCQRIIKQDTENAMKNVSTGKNKSEEDADEQCKALSKKIEILDRKIDNILDRLASLTSLSICNATCPKGYIYYQKDKFCFKFYTECKSWLEARKTCQQDGGDLISLKESNFDFFKRFAQLQEGKCTNQVWVGTTDISSEGKWYWLNGEKISSIFWMSGQPDSSGRNEHCGEIIIGFSLNDRNCAEKNDFLCQIVQ